MSNTHDTLPVNVTQPIKVALVGAGGWGRQHARIFAARPDVAFCAIVGGTT